MVSRCFFFFFGFAVGVSCLLSCLALVSLRGWEPVNRGDMILRSFFAFCWPDLGPRWHRGCCFFPPPADAIFVLFLVIFLPDFPEEYQIPALYAGCACAVAGALAFVIGYTGIGSAFFFFFFFFFFVFFFFFFFFFWIYFPGISVRI